MSIKTELDVAQLQLLADCLRKVQIGSVLDGLANPVEAESLSVSAHVHTFAYKPLAIIGSVHVTTGDGAPLAYKVLPSGQTPATHECAVNIASGTITFRAGDAVTAGKVSYLKKPTNLVANLAATSF